MNALPSPRRLLSARDLANLRLPDAPQSERAAWRFIEDVRKAAPQLTSERAGSGRSGWLVDLTALPATARAELERRERVAARKAEAERAVAELSDEAAMRQVDAAVIRRLTAGQQRVMEARRALLLALDLVAAEVGRDKAVLEFVARSRAGALTREQAALALAANDKRDDATLSRPTLYRWIKAFEQGGLPALAPKRARAPAERPWFPRFMKFYALPTKPSVVEALDNFNRERAQAGLPPISLKQARCALAAAPAIQKHKGREGKLALRARQVYVSRTFDDIAVSSIYVGDGKTFDAEIAHPLTGGAFRPEITTLIDVASRRITGWSAGLDEKALGVMDALRRACAECGVPAIFYTDRGPGYRNKAMDDPLTGFLARAGITAMRALPYNSQAKGVVERVNKIYTAAAKALPSYIGHDMDKEARHRAFKQSRADLKEHGRSRLLMGWEEFCAHIEATVAAYNNRPHSSLPMVHDAQLGRQRRMTPNEMWAHKAEEIELIVPDAIELDLMFRPWEVRRTNRGLISFNSNSYFALELEAWHGRDVIVGYDLRDASRVWVREIATTQDGEIEPGRMIAVAIFEGNARRYVPHTMERAAVETRAKGQLARLAIKRDAVEAQLLPFRTLDLAATPAGAIPAPVSLTISEIPASSGAGDAGSGFASPQNGTVSSSGGRPTFADDVSLCLWLAAHPDRATPADRETLRDLLTTHSSKELLRMEGLDLEALTSIARSQTTQPEPSKDDDR